MASDAGDPVLPEDGVAPSARRPRTSRISPRLSLLLIGGIALGGIGCMCLGVVALAIWQAT